RIVKGQVCPKGQCPWQALLKLRGVVKCGGVILNYAWILTAAHCVWQANPLELQVTVGEHILTVFEGTEQHRRVSKIIIHPLYNSTSYDVDIALLHLRRNISLGPFVIPICLPPAQGTFVRTLGAVRTSVVSGWGRLSQHGAQSNLLQRLEVPRVSLEKCKAHSGLSLTNNMLCAGFKEGGRDACRGDSGGPLVTCYNNTWFLTGIVSWGKGCARADMYGIYTRVSVFVETTDIIQHATLICAFFGNELLLLPSFRNTYLSRLHFFLTGILFNCLSSETFPCGKVQLFKSNTSEKDSRARIVGGAECPRGLCPWQVLLKYGQKNFCGGVIYKPTWIITASHCLEKLAVKFLKIVAGEYDIEVEEGSEQTIEVDEMVKHPNYSSATTDNDIALLRLRRPIVYSMYAIPVCLPRKTMAERELWRVRFHTVSGWGQRAEGGPTARYLRRLKVPRIHTQDCLRESQVSLTLNMFCAGYFEGKEDSCKGDSGGPLVTVYGNTTFLLGIVSWGKGCARPGHYGIYTRVSNYLDWIHKPFSRLKGLSQPPPRPGPRAKLVLASPRLVCTPRAGYLRPVRLHHPRSGVSTVGPVRDHCCPHPHPPYPSRGVKYPCGKAPLQLTHSVFPRAVGGNQCPKGHCPWQVLLTYDGKNLCGGVLVDTKWILTAAHCVYKRDVKHLKVITGEHNIDMVDGNEQTFSVSQAVIHESYDPASGDSDLALLELSKPATLSKYTVPICLPNSDFAKMELDAARFHVVSGWGRHTEGGNNPSNKSFKNLSPVLRMLTVPFLPKPECTVKSGVNVTDNMLCAGYFEGSQESCRGDDGSPLTTHYKDTHFLTGIVSWGKGCDNPGYYAIYTKVANFLDWIQRAMAT
ncbi:coagulation factor VII precursor, partial [Silurus asotus]